MGIGKPCYFNPPRNSLIPFFNSYAPPRTQWLTGNTQSNDISVGQGENAVTMRSSPPLDPRHPTPLGSIPNSEAQNAVELPADVAPPALIISTEPSAGDYHEDMDPRFLESSQDVNPGDNATTYERIPAMLIPGYNPQIGSSRPLQSRSPAQFQRPNYSQLQNNPEHGYPPGPQNGGQQYAPYAQGQLTFPEYDGPPQSPAFSEQTNFTGISRRPVNPPPPGQQPPGRGPPRNMPLLSGNPDFELPTLSQGRGGIRGRTPGAIPPELGSDRGGRYPLPPPNIPR